MHPFHDGDGQDDYSYQDQLDNRFYKGSLPSKKTPFTLMDLAQAMTSLLISFLGKDVYTLICYHITGSLEHTCKKCKISKRTFYYYKRHLMRRFKFFLSRKHRTK